MKFCTQCGAQMRDDSTFCTSCGTQMKAGVSDGITKPEPPVYVIGVPSVPPVPPVSPVKTSKKKLNILLAIGIPAVILVILAIVIILKPFAGRMIIGTWINADHNSSVMIFDKNGLMYDDYGLPSAYSIKNGILTINRPFALGTSVAETYGIRFSGGKLILRLDDDETVWIRPENMAAHAMAPTAYRTAPQAVSSKSPEAGAASTPTDVSTPISNGTPISNATQTPDPDPTPTPVLLPNGDTDLEDFYLGLASRYIDTSELTGFTKEQVTYIRNAIYAMCGKFFTTEKFIDYFNSKDWYAPYGDASDDIEARMNDYQQTNLWTIVDYETSMGWR